MELIQIFQELGWIVTVASHAKPNAALNALHELNIATQEIELNRSSFDTWLDREQFHVVVFDRFIMEEQFGARVARSLPKSVRILDTQDLHSLRRAREAIIKGGGSIEESLQAGTQLAGPDFLRELGSIYRSDLTLVLSDYEFDILTEHYSLPKDLLLYFPFAIAPKKPYPTTPEASSNFAFLGNFRHPPNFDSIFWTIRELWPKIRAQKTDATLRVMGAYPPKEVMALANSNEGISVEGPVKDSIAELGKSSVGLAPLRFGAGIKGKICDSWAAGRPVVTTEIGAEGMRLGNLFGGLVANNPQELADAAIKTLTNPDLAQKLTSEGRQILEQKFSHAKLKAELSQEIKKIHASLDSHRQKNPIGALLMQDERRASDYFSRWIELKEKTAISES
jgi:glycosyltransferase involved in cell wall biosynthesis